MRGVVLFDGVCVLCDRSMRFLLARDRKRRLKFAPLQGETAREIFSRHPEMDRSLSTVIYVRSPGGDEEKIYDRSDAAFAILGDLGGLFKLACALRVLPRPWRDALYDWIARHRYAWFGKLDACRLPEASMSERFLP